MQYRVSDKFVVTKIRKSGTDEIILTAKIDGLQKNFKIKFAKIGLVNLPIELEFILRGNDISLPKTFLQMLQDYKEGVEILMPFVVFEQARKNKEKIAA